MVKTILCYGDSNVRGYIPGSFDEKIGLSKRYPKNKRWSGVLAQLLGEKYDVIEEGLNGRTTIFDETIPGRPYRNGLTLLPLFLESHYPIDLVIFMLGTNDTKLQFNRTPEEITEGMQTVVDFVQRSNLGSEGRAPKVLVLAPPWMLQVPDLYDEFNGAPVEKSKVLPALYEKMTQAAGCAFLDLSPIITSSRHDGAHLEEAEHRLLGHAVAEKVRGIL